MWWHIGCHPDSNARCAIDQEIWQHCGKNFWLFFTIVKIWHKFDQVLIEMVKQCHRALRQTRLRVAHRGGRIAVERAKIAMPIHQWDLHRKFFRHMYQSIIDGRIAVRVVFTHGITDDAGTFSVRFFRVKSKFGH